MTPARRPNTRHEPLPSIIIHPSLYKPERRFWLQRVCEGFIELARIAVVVTVVGTATAGVAHVIQQRTRLPHETIRIVASDCLPPASAPDDLQPDSDEGVIATVAGAAADPDLLAATNPRTRVPAQAPLLAAKSTRRGFDLSESVRYARRMFALNRLEEAELAYRKVLAISDRQLAALVGLARVLLARGQHAEAEALAERAVAQAPEQAASQLTLGDVLRARGEDEASAAHYLLATLASMRDSRASSARSVDPL